MLDYQAQDDAIRQFADVLANAGLLLKGLPVMDGRLHHVPTVGAKSKSDNAGVYVGHLDGVPAGWFNNYRTDPSGEGHKWKATGITDIRSSAEIQKSRQEAERRRAQTEQQRTEQEERIARWAERKWNRSEAAGTHPYLERKDVEAHGFRIDTKNRLVVPMRDADGKIWSLQTISADGEKHYTSGGRKKGLHAIIGAYDPAKPLVFAEGFATAASVHQATGLTVAVVFDSGNLKPVAETYRARNAAQPLIFAADNDHHLPLKKAPTGSEMPNVGVQKAQEAARAVNGSVVIPPFERGNPGTDWNDYAAQHGLRAVREAFRGLSRSAPPVSDTPGVANVLLDQQRPSSERPLSKQEVSMPEQSAAAVAATQKEDRQSDGPQPEQPDQKSPDRTESAGSASNPETSRIDQRLKRLTRADVERALQTGASLAQKDLSGLDLSNLKFARVNLAGSNLSGSRNVNTSYEDSRLDGVNFSDALFRASTIERVFAVNSRWDRAQFDQTDILFSNFGNASFRDAVFRDVARTRDREEPAHKSQAGSNAFENQETAEAIRKPGRPAWTEVAARAGTFLKDIGKALKGASVEVYHRVRDWWMQPLQLAPEIDRSVPAAWAAAAPPAYEAYNQGQAQTWGTPQPERVQAQAYSHTNVQGQGSDGRVSRALERKTQKDALGSAQNTDTRSSAKPAEGASDVTEAIAHIQPALIARNNFQFADFTGARFESIRVQDNDFRHAVLANAQFPAELHASNKVERDPLATKQNIATGASAEREAAEPLRQAKTEAERQQDRTDLVETIRREIENRERKLWEGDSALYRDADGLHLAKEMLRQLEAGAERIDLTTVYKAGDEGIAKERHVRAYNSVNPLIAEAYAKGITVERGSANLDRAQAITDEAARLHDDVNAANNVQDRKDLLAETKTLEAEGVSLRAEGEARDRQIRSNLDREGITPLLSMEQDRFDALLSVGVFDIGKSPEWRKEMDHKISERFTMLSAQPENGKDQRTLWQEAAKQVQQGEMLMPQQQPREASEDRGLGMDDPSQLLSQKQESRRALAHAR